MAGISSQPPDDGTPDWFDEGLEAFNNKDYDRSVSRFEKYLEVYPDEPRGSWAHAYLALARLALAPPAGRTVAHVRRVVPHLNAAGSSPLTSALAAIVLEDWATRHADRPAGAADVSGLAAESHVEALTPYDLRLLEQHVRPHRGETWWRISLHARRYGVVLADSENRAPDPRRRGLVERYCAAPPTRPAVGDATSPAVVWGFTGVGGAAVVAAWLSDTLVVPWTRGFALFVVLLAVGTTLLTVALVYWHRLAAERRRVRQYDQDLVAATPKATDAEMDRWLVEEVDRIVKIGAFRHRMMRRQGWAERGDQHGGPLVLVGLCGLRRDHRYYRDAPEVDPHSWLDIGTAEMEHPLSLTACRRSDRDGKLRANRYDVMVLYPDRDAFFVFRADLNLATGRLLSTSTQTLRYTTGITVYDRELPARGLAENPVTVRYDDSGGDRHQVFADRCFTITMPGQRVEIAIGISRHRAGRFGPVTVAWPNRAAQRLIEHILWPDRDDPHHRGADERDIG
jgi:hypothetical protein